MACVGLLISLATGIVPLLAGYAFMDHTVWHTNIPLFGHDHLPSATFFDLGVFLIVMGTLTTIFVELGLEGGQ
jgi:multisubunit Na+/H+ antiporter MnhB subunit